MNEGNGASSGPDYLLPPKLKVASSTPASTTGISAPAPAPIIDTISRPVNKPATNGGTTTQTDSTTQPAASFNWGGALLIVGVIWLLSSLGKDN